MDFFGLDIGFKKTKVSQINWINGLPILAKLGEALTPENILGSDDPKDLQLIADTIKLAMDDATIKTRDVVISIPEIFVTSRLETNFPKLQDVDLADSIIFEAKKYITYPIDQMHIDKYVLDEYKIGAETKVNVFWVATSKSVVDRYLKIAKLANLNVLALETESIASARAFQYAYPTEPNSKYYDLVVDIGENGTDIFTVSNGLVFSSQSISAGSGAITKVIASSFGLDLTKAENFKKTYGLDPNFAEGKSLQTLEPIAKMLLDEVGKDMNFISQRLAGHSLRYIALTGEAASMKNLEEYATNYLSKHVGKLDIFKSIVISNELKNVIPYYSGSGFMVSIGLAMKTS